MLIMTAKSLQIVECRRVLKWTYAYGYYLPEHEHAKRQFFEYLQGFALASLQNQLPFRNTFRCFPCCIEALIINAVGEAESGLERLHQCAEKELQGYLDAEGPTKEFNEFRTKLAGLTRYLDSELNLELQSISTSGW